MLMLWCTAVSRAKGKAAFSSMHRLRPTVRLKTMLVKRLG